jgi:hypothetical protein
MLTLPLLSPSLPASLRFGVWIGLHGALERWPWAMAASALQVSGNPCWETRPHAGTHQPQNELEQCRGCTAGTEAASENHGGWLGIAFYSQFSSQGLVLDNSSCLEPSGSNSRLLALSPCLGQPPCCLPTERTISPHLSRLLGFGQHGTSREVFGSLADCGLSLTVVLPACPFYAALIQPPGRALPQRLAMSHNCPATAGTIIWRGNHLGSGIYHP